MLYCVFIVYELYVIRVSQTLTSESSYVSTIALIYFWILQNEMYQIFRCICPKWKKVFSRLCKVFVINQLHATWHTAFGRHETFTSQHTGTAFENINIFHKIQVLYTTYLFGFLYPNIYHSMILWNKRHMILSYAHWLWAEIVICGPAPSIFSP